MVWCGAVSMRGRESDVWSREQTHTITWTHLVFCPPSLPNPVSLAFVPYKQVTPFAASASRISASVLGTSPCEDDNNSNTKRDLTTTTTCAKMHLAIKHVRSPTKPCGGYFLPSIVRDMVEVCRMVWVLRESDHQAMLRERFAHRKKKIHHGGLPFHSVLQSTTDAPSQVK